MNFVIKSVLFWFVFLIFISFVSTYFFAPVSGVNVALTQFSDTEGAQAELQKLGHKNNISMLCVGAFWCLAIGIYVNMAINAAKNKEDEVDSE